ncbi:cytoskeletal protein CcmA (bactofilin family) [Kibdelosporangium banguiense]|uniref:Cytoskeletal protein CcmA (Bactofilin family) n=1 Tax=Kibdelosporangium banguiense TaxID=1365924 RepID=A0ABS4TCA2_9PSEU|nr:hypothetical protein [Kibdelosporangium banguiense]MBP2321966.1 cytoskeletal protein CcmA (bactofilin family) [Kibdelosporangium banguiense]
MTPAEPPPAEARRLDVQDPAPGKWAHMAAADVVRRVVEPDGAGIRWRRKSASPPVIVVEDKFLTGKFSLRALEFPYVLEFVRCRFEQAPDLRQAKIAGLEFRDCWLPGLSAKNMRCDNDLVLSSTTVDGEPIDLVDSEIEGSVNLSASRIGNRTGRALLADRLVLAGALLANNLVAHGEIRMPGLRAGGNVNFSGATLDNPEGYALNGYGMHVGGNLLCGIDVTTQERFSSTGWVFLPATRVDSDFSLRGAELRPADMNGSEGSADPGFDLTATLIADRIRVEGNLELDRGLRSTGTLRIVNAMIGGSLRLSSSDIDVSAEQPPPWPHRALHLDGTQISGDFDARSIRMAGQARMVDVTIRGSLLLDGANLRNPESDAILGRRFSVGGNLDGRFVEVAGCLSFQGAKIGANLDLRGSRLIEPGRHLRTGAVSPSVDIRAATVGRDLILAAGHRPFAAHGGVRMHRAEIGREANFDGAMLGSGLGGTALNAHGMVAQELVLTVGQAPRGRVTLRHARCASLADNDKFWDGTGRIDLEDFRYEALAIPIDVKDDAAVRTRLRWLRTSMQGTYSPGPYDQLATVFRSSGNEEHAATVLIEKHRWRYVAMADGMRVLGPGVRMWSWLQRSMVGYGYRPTRALVWLLVCLALGSVWFGLHPRPNEINADDSLIWNPVLYTLDLLVPIIDFGNKNRWQAPGTSQWIASGLIATGWILATTAAAGLTRMLRRN